MAEDISWTCPYCNQVATIKYDNVSGNTHTFNNNNKLGALGIQTYVTVCPNSKCREFTIEAGLYNVRHDPSLRFVGKSLLNWKLKPQSTAKPFPDYIPVPIRQDYEEACLICDLSPKASATLSRRCLQGIIRDFWEISKPKLVQEINELKDKIDPATWQAIDAVRSIGNIGAHMEKDINLIIDVEPEEADMLLRLIEVLLQEWYVNRYERNEHMNKIIATAKAKAIVKAVEKP
jgi:hypothetical protein